MKKTMTATFALAFAMPALTLSFSAEARPNGYHGPVNVQTSRCNHRGAHPGARRYQRPLRQSYGPPRYTPPRYANQAYRHGRPGQWAQPNHYQAPRAPRAHQQAPATRRHR